MKRCSIILVCLCVACSAIGRKAPEEDIYSQRFITAIMKKVCDWQLAHPVEINSRNSNGWARSAFYTGVMATYHTTGDKRYLNHAMTWAEHEGWKRGDRPRHADDHTCGQTYLELYFIKKDPGMIADMIETFDAMIADPKPGRVDWWWCDALFMAPPTLARLARATENPKYLDFLHTLWWDTTDFLFDEDAGLYYRDENFIGKRNANDRKIFWSRGNGWVVGGIVRVLQFLPDEDPYRARYIRLLRTMAATLARVQGPDGFWRTSLFDPAQAPAPESSGTGFFCYGIAWGINKGILDRDVYLPVVEKAWKGLVGAVHPDGRLGWVQQIGHQPEDVSYDDYQEYGAGAFLLAASEMVKLR